MTPPEGSSIGRVFHDRATVFVRAGAGGDGSVSFRREAHVPKGGPDGGDGGRGGDVVLVCDPSRRDLSEFHRGAHFNAQRGGHGEGSQRHGASAPALEIKVPPGTVAEDFQREIRWELVSPGQRVAVAKPLLPRPPEPPDATTARWPGFTSSQRISRWESSATVPGGTFISRAGALAPWRCEPSP